MNKLSKIAAATLICIAALNPTITNAATATGTFDVTVNLTPTCIVTVGENVNLTYTSFQTTASTGTSIALVKCTHSLPYSLSMSGPTTVSGITFTSVIGESDDGAGSGTNLPFQVTITAAAGQSGICSSNTGCTGTVAQTIVVTY